MLGLGAYLFETSDKDFYDLAIKCYDDAIRLDPSYAAAWYNKGEALRKLHRNSEADAALAKAKELGYNGSIPSSDRSSSGSDLNQEDYATTVYAWRVFDDWAKRLHFHSTHGY
jgi:tetratricopeptide (TPR) repeat protein